MNRLDASYHHAPRKNWWNRNWKWFVPTGCLSLIIIFGATVFFVVTTFMKKSVAYQVAMEKATTNSYVIDALGEPIEQKGMTEGSISIKNSSGEAELYIPIKGSKREGMIYVSGTKYNGEWTFDVMKVSVKSSRIVIDLLEE